MAKTRSPNYPQFTLEDAIELVRKVWKQEGQTKLTLEAAAKAIGYSSASGPARAKIAVLKKYGLLDQSEKGMGVTKLAVRIVGGQPDAPEYDTAIREAALKDELFRSLAESHLTASQDAIQSHLIVNQKFTEDGAETCAKTFIATREFAKLTKPAAIEGEPESGQGGQDEPPEGGKKTKKRRQVEAGIKEDVYTLGAGDAVLQWPARLTQEEYEELGDWLSLMQRKLKRSIVSEPATPEDEEDSEDNFDD